jgi:hypothetical protein
MPKKQTTDLRDLIIRHCFELRHSAFEEALVLEHAQPNDGQRNMAK